MRNVQNIAADWAAGWRRAVAAFFNISKDDGWSEVRKKVSWIVSKRTLYFVLDYSMSAAETAGIIVLYAHGYSPATIFWVTWLFELACAIFFLVLWQKTNEDITLGENSRRAVDKLRERSKWVARTTSFFLFLLGFFWEGPEKIIIYYQKELNTLTKMSIALLVLTASHAVVWALASVGLFELWKSIV